jgi:CubicO group peptidase (beta-lactamase class C family)
MLTDMMLRRRTFLAGAAFAAAAAPAFARTSSAVQALFDRYVAEKKLAGASLAITSPTRTSYVNAGTLAFDSAARFDETTLARVYSMTKTMTGTAAALLIEDGKLKLDQPVADFFPAYANLKVATDPKTGLDGTPAKAPLTVRHLLTHTGGLAYHINAKSAVTQAYRANGLFAVVGIQPEAGDGAPPRSLAEFAERLATMPLIAEPGTVWNYSVGLDLLGAVIERACGMPFDAFLRARILGPLDMRSTAFRALDAARLATNYFKLPTGLFGFDTAANSPFLPYPAVPYGGSGLVSSARDWARFGAMHLGDGRVGDVRVMKPETARLIRSNILPDGVAYTDSGGYGFGGRVVTPATKDANDSIGSYGWGGAAGTLFWVDPAKRRSATLMVQYMPSEAYPELRRDLRKAITADFG